MQIAHYDRVSALSTGDMEVDKLACEVADMVVDNVHWTWRLRGRKLVHFPQGLHTIHGANTLYTDKHTIHRLKHYT